MKTFAVGVEKNTPYIAMLVVQSIYAGMALFSKVAISQGTNPFVFVAYRQAFATLSLAPFAYFFERKNATQLSHSLLGKIFLSSLFGNTLSLNLYYVAMNHTTATFAAATTNLIPSITFAIALLLRMETVCVKRWHGLAKVLGSIASVAGALVFAFVKGPALKLLNSNPTTNHENHTGVMRNNSSSSSYGEWLKGPLVMLSANTVWSFWVILQAPIVKQYPAKLRLLTLQCFFGSIQGAIWAIAMERNLASWKLGWNINLFSLAYCGVIVSGIGYWLQLRAIEKNGPVFTAMFTPLALVITAIFSAFLWKETVHLGSVLGAILLAGGLYCVLWGKSKDKEQNQLNNEEKSAKTREEIVLESITHQ